MHLFVQILALLCLLQCREVLTAISSQCMDCIWKVESNKAMTLGCKMDVGSLACGPFQIHHNYYKDCTNNNKATVKDWQDCTKNYSCARRCVVNYMNRHGGKKCGTTCEDYARMHNGGPNGCNTNTNVYWNKIKQSGCNRNS